LKRARPTSYIESLISPFFLCFFGFVLPSTCTIPMHLSTHPLTRLPVGVSSLYPTSLPSPPFPFCPSGRRFSHWLFGLESNCCKPTFSALRSFIRRCIFSLFEVFFFFFVFKVIVPRMTSPRSDCFSSDLNARASRNPVIFCPGVNFLLAGFSPFQAVPTLHRGQFGTLLSLYI